MRFARFSLAVSFASLSIACVPDRTLAPPPPPVIDEAPPESEEELQASRVEAKEEERVHEPLEQLQGGWLFAGEHSQVLKGSGVFDETGLDAQIFARKQEMFRLSYRQTQANHVMFSGIVDEKEILMHFVVADAPRVQIWTSLDDELFRGYRIEPLPEEMRGSWKSCSAKADDAPFHEIEFGEAASSLRLNASDNEFVRAKVHWLGTVAGTASFGLHPLEKGAPRLIHLTLVEEGLWLMRLGEDGKAMFLFRPGKRPTWGACASQSM